MYEYGMDPTRTVGATERTRDAGRAGGQADRRTDGRMDGRIETNIPSQAPNNFVVRGIMILLNNHVDDFLCMSMYSVRWNK